ncbi:MAG: 16S rRNA (guanine(527)-N(7))-methyltransferase RsmG [Myxococcota bacterium]
MTTSKDLASFLNSIFEEHAPQGDGSARFPSKTRDALLAYGELVTLWSKRMNLTGVKDPAGLADVLYRDALVLAFALPSTGRLVDVGSGAGAPAIPLALLMPRLAFTLVEPLRKRVTFLRTAVGQLGLADRVRVVEGKIEDAAFEDAGFESGFDIALSRATFAPSRWVEIGTELAPLVCALTSGEVPSAPEGMGCETIRYRWSTSAEPRLLLIYRRV